MFIELLQEARNVNSFRFKDKATGLKFNNEIKKLNKLYVQGNKSASPQLDAGIIVSVDFDKIKTQTDKGRIRKIADDLGVIEITDQMTGQKINEANYEKKELILKKK